MLPNITFIIVFATNASHALLKKTHTYSSHCVLYEILSSTWNHSGKIQQNTKILSNKRCFKSRRGKVAVQIKHILFAPRVWHVWLTKPFLFGFFRWQCFVPCNASHCSIPISSATKLIGLGVKSQIVQQALTGKGKNTDWFSCIKP